MVRMLAAPSAIFFQCDTFGGGFFVLPAGIIPAFTNNTLKRYQISHIDLTLFSICTYSLQKRRPHNHQPLYHGIKLLTRLHANRELRI